MPENLGDWCGTRVGSVCQSASGLDHKHRFFIFINKEQLFTFCLPKKKKKKTPPPKI